MNGVVAYNGKAMGGNGAKLGVHGGVSDIVLTVLQRGVAINARSGRTAQSIRRLMLSE